MLKRFDRYKKLALIGGISINLGILLYFKYTDFFIKEVNRFFGTEFLLINILLPLGISFFTFQQISFIIDSYREEKDLTRYSFVSYMAYVTFFPQLVAGPIVFHNELIPQLTDKKNKSFNGDNFARGIYEFVLGLSKKVLIADSLGSVVNAGYSSITEINSTSLLLVMLSYTFQIYFDFSGYCDMASGLARMFNIKLPVNFNSPYKAVDISDFWKRWHMTLTRFFTQYLYIPLGGSRRGKLRTYVNVLIVFLASGLWHGANETFILWGLLHGVALVINRAFRSVIDRVWKPVRWLVTFIFVNLTWVFFRADSIGDAIIFLKRLFACRFMTINESIYSYFYNTDMQIINGILHISDIFPHFAVAVWLVLPFCVTILSKNVREKTETFKPDVLRSIMISVLFVLCILSLSGESTFLYFNF